MIKGIWPLCFLIIPVKQVVSQVMAGRLYVTSPPGVLKKININGNILQRYFTCKKNGVPIIVANVIWRKTLISYVIIPPTFNFFASI